MTLPDHQEHIITTIKEVRNLTQMSLENSYGVLKTYEFEEEQRKAIYGKGKRASTSTTLVAQEPNENEVKIERLSLKAEEFVKVELEDAQGNDDDFYTIEELEQLENKTKL